MRILRDVDRKVNDDITAFLPADTDTRRGLTVMEEEFVTYADAKVMLANTTYERAEAAMNDMLGGIGASLADARYLMQEAIFVAGDTRDIINSLFVMPIDTPADGLLPTETTPSEWLERNSAAEDAVLAAYTVKAPGYTGELTVRMRAPEGGRLYVLSDGAAVSHSFTRDGSYIVFALENGGSVIYAETERTEYLWPAIGGGAAVIAAAGAYLLFRRKKKRPTPAESGEQAE